MRSCLLNKLVLYLYLKLIKIIHEIMMKVRIFMQTFKFFFSFIAFRFERLNQLLNDLAPIQISNMIVKTAVFTMQKLVLEKIPCHWSKLAEFCEFFLMNVVVLVRRKISLYLTNFFVRKFFIRVILSVFINRWLILFKTRKIVSFNF